MKNARKQLLKLGALVLLTVLCSWLERGTAAASPYCVGDPTGNLAWCCERSGYIFSSCNGVCCCLDDYGNQVSICGG
jgi:hypothetical protein